MPPITVDRLKHRWLIHRYRGPAPSPIRSSVFGRYLFAIPAPLGTYLAQKPQMGVFFAALGGHTRPSLSPGVARLYASRLDYPCSCLPAPTGVCRRARTNPTTVGRYASGHCRAEEAAWQTPGRKIRSAKGPARCRDRNGQAGEASPGVAKRTKEERVGTGATRR